MRPALPIIEVEVCPPDLARLDADAPVVTMEKDSAGRWWHGVGGVLVRPATTLETLLPLSPRTWRERAATASERSDGTSSM